MYQKQELRQLFRMLLMQLLNKKTLPKKRIHKQQILLMLNPQK